MLPHRTIDAGMGLSIGITGVASVAHINEILQMFAYLVAIASGLPAVYHYVSAWLAKRKKK